MVTNKKRTGGKRGQQMGFAGQPDRNRTEINETPAFRGNRKAANKMFGDVSDQQTGSNVVAPSTNSPSTPAMKESCRSGRSGPSQERCTYSRLRVVRR